MYIPLRRLKVAILKLPLPLPLLQSAIMEICAILKAQTDAAAASSNLLINRLEEAAGFRGSGNMYIIDKIHKKKFQNRHFKPSKRYVHKSRSTYFRQHFAD